MAINEDTKLEELQRIKGELKELLPLLSKWRVEELQKLVSHFYMGKWKRKHFRKYGSLNKGFTREELDRFLSAVKDAKFRLLFSYQAFLALRVGEVCKVNLSDINFSTRELKVKTEKAHTLDLLTIPQFLFDETLAFIRAHNKEIEAHQGYLFYADTERSHKAGIYLNLNYVRNMFRYYTSLAGLDEVYDTTEESIPERTKRRLHRLTTHSLRHFGITTFSRAVNGNIVLTSKYARHREISSTQVYIHTSKDELYEAINKAFQYDVEVAHNVQA